MNDLCKKCAGECCKYINIPLWDMPEDIEWMEARGYILENDGSLIWRIPSRCKHLSDEGMCKIYDTRPQTCRDYEVEGGACNRAREFAASL